MHAVVSSIMWAWQITFLCLLLHSLTIFFSLVLDLRLRTEPGPEVLFAHSRHQHRASSGRRQLLLSHRDPHNQSDRCQWLTSNYNWGHVSLFCISTSCFLFISCSHKLTFILISAIGFQSFWFISKDVWLHFHFPIVLICMQAIFNR